MTCQKRYIISCGCCTLLLIGALLAAILIPVSLNSLNYDEFGIAYNTLAKRIDYDKVYEEGRHFLSIPSTFLKYKRTVQSISWGSNNQITCYSSEGLKMTIEMKVQYQIMKDKVFSIFDNFGKEENYLGFLQNFIRYNIINQCGNFYAQQFYFNRSVIEKSFENSLIHIVEGNDFGSDIVLLQMISVSHPPPYNNINEEKQKLLQDRQKLIRKREELINQEYTAYLKVNKSIEILMIASYAESNSTIIAAQKKAEAENNRWDTRRKIYTNYKSRPSELINFLKYQMVRTKDNIIQKFD